MIGLTKTAALENAAARIRVNAICPGMTATGATMHWATTDPAGFEAFRSTIPMQVTATPEQQAQVAVWLCSDAASYVTGVATWGVSLLDGVREFMVVNSTVITVFVLLVLGAKLPGDGLIGLGR